MDTDIFFFFFGRGFEPAVGCLEFIQTSMHFTSEARALQTDFAGCNLWKKSFFFQVAYLTDYSKSLRVTVFFVAYVAYPLLCVYFVFFKSVFAYLTFRGD